MTLVGDGEEVEVDVSGLTIEEVSYSDGATLKGTLVRASPVARQATVILANYPRKSITLSADRVKLIVPEQDE